MLNEYPQIIKAITNTPWLIVPESLDTICQLVNMRLNGEAFSDEEIRIRLDAAAKENNGQKDNPRIQIGGGVGVVSLYGPIFPKANLLTMLSGATSMDAFTSDLRELMANDSVKQIVMDINSPGGASDMIAETGKLIKDFSKEKPIYAIANTQAGSAALWLLSQATKAYATPSGKVGSLGAYTVHEDRSAADAKNGTKITYVSAGRYKTAGNPHEPLSQDAKDYLQESIDELNTEFVEAVASGRGKTVDEVDANFGQGKMLSPKKAAEVGMIDEVKSMNDLLSGLVESNYQSNYASAKGDLAHNVNKMEQAAIKGGTLLTNPAEFTEPGQADNPDPNLNRDNSADGRWRRDTPPAGEDGSVPARSRTVTDPNAGTAGARTSNNDSTNKNKGGDNKVDEQLQALYAALGLSEDADMTAFVAHVTALNEEVKPLRELKKLSNEQHTFAEMFPEQHARMEKLEADNRELFGKQFSEKFEASRFTRKVGTGDDVRDEQTTTGLSALSLAAVGDFGKYLTEAVGDVGVTKFTEVLNTIFDNGIVDYGTKGSSRTDDSNEDAPSNVVPIAGSKNARDEFAKLVNEVQNELTAASDTPNVRVPYEVALHEAAKRDPELADAWRQPPVAASGR